MLHDPLKNIKLVSHETFSERHDKERKLKDSEESDHHRTFVRVPNSDFSFHGHRGRCLLGEGKSTKYFRIPPHLYIPT
jgi:hypothetical protein